MCDPLCLACFSDYDAFSSLCVVACIQVGTHFYRWGVEAPIIHLRSFCVAQSKGSIIFSYINNNTNQ